MAKASPNVYYEDVNGSGIGRYTLNQLYRQVIRPRMARSAILGSCSVTRATESGPLPPRIVFGRDRRGQSKQWLAVWSTDRSVADDEVVRIYGKRWAIETFFKVAKSLLEIPREYLGRSYEGTMAHVIIVCIRYQWLALEARTAEDVRTLSDLFFVHCQELEDLTFG
ncbi:MAG: transposase [Firmicutes bacterium]|nr:transposase [Bacillota bacterium]